MGFWDLNYYIGLAYRRLEWRLVASSTPCQLSNSESGRGEGRPLHCWSATLLIFRTSDMRDSSFSLFHPYIVKAGISVRQLDSYAHGFIGADGRLEIKWDTDVSPIYCSYDVYYLHRPIIICLKKVQVKVVVIGDLDKSQIVIVPIYKF